jgi:hypothetical protein
MVFSSMSRRVSSPFLIHLSLYVIKNLPHAHAEAEGLKYLHLFHDVFKRHDPMGIVKDHCSSMHLSHLYQHDDLPDEFHL